MSSSENVNVKVSNSFLSMVSRRKNRFSLGSNSEFQRSGMFDVTPFCYEIVSVCTLTEAFNIILAIVMITHFHISKDL